MNIRSMLAIFGALIAAVLGWVLYCVYFQQPPFGDLVDVVERTDYNPPTPNAQDVLDDDKASDKKPVNFDPALVDRRPLGEKKEWLVNSSAALIRLNVPMVKGDQEPYLLTLHPSYAAAIKSTAYTNVLPSVNVIDGKAKQFDDGLYAALDQAYYQGLKNQLTSHVQLVRRLFDKLPKDSPAAPFLAASLELAGVKVDVADAAAKTKLLSDFRANEVASKPIGFYTWNPTLSDCFRFLRFLAREFSENELAIPLAMTHAFNLDAALQADYRKALGFYAHLTNPFLCLSVADITGVGPVSKETIEQVCQEKKVTHQAVALFPPSTSKETVLFEKLFPRGLPPNADLMRELVRRIRSGEVNLKPGPDSGWYDYQVYALETLLLPEKGEERDKLLLTKSYKKRMLEAFQALITKRRETHVRQLGPGAKSAAEPPHLPDKLSPRLRLEPCPSYCLRTARAYAFLVNFLEAAVGKDALQQLHGLKKDGPRAQNLFVELTGMRDLFFGLYFVSAEDIGLKPSLAKDEPVDADRCYKLADDWLKKAFADEDLAEDTRVSVPVYVDGQKGTTRLWLTLGVRLTRLDSRYIKPPSLKPAQGDGDWKMVDDFRLAPAEFLIPVDEFAEMELAGPRVLTRDELRAVCNREKTKEAIVNSLRK